MGFRDRLSRIFQRILSAFDPTPPPHTINALRTLPYAPLPLYDIITDIPSYPQFVPFVLNARVTERSPRADAHHDRRWPAVVALEVAFGDFARESFSSRIVCEPPTEETEGVVETFGGDATPVLNPTHYDEYIPPDELGDSPLRRVRAEWRVKEIEGGSQMRLRVEYTFRSQVFEQVGTAMAKKVTDQVADAFEARAKEILGKA